MPFTKRIRKIVFETFPIRGIWLQKILMGAIDAVKRPASPTVWVGAWPSGGLAQHPATGEDMWLNMMVKENVPLYLRDKKKLFEDIASSGHLNTKITRTLPPKRDSTQLC